MIVVVVVSNLHLFQFLFCKQSTSPSAGNHKLAISVVLAGNTVFLFHYSLSLSLCTFYILMPYVSSSMPTCILTSEFPKFVWMNIYRSFLICPHALYIYGAQRPNEYHQQIKMLNINLFSYNIFHLENWHSYKDYHQGHPKAEGQYFIRQTLNLYSYYSYLGLVQKLFSVGFQGFFCFFFPLSTAKWLP